MAEEDLSPEEIDALSQAIDDAADDPPTQEKDTEDPAKEVQGNDDEAMISKAQFMQLEEALSDSEEPISASIERFFEVKVDVEVILGKKKITLDEILKLQPGKLVELDKLAGEPVELTANNKIIAKGEVVVIEDHFGVKILEIAGTRQKINVAGN